MKRRHVFAVLLLASLANCYPALLPLGGDILFHRVVIDCFATQFWQGDFYPRWCMDINNGQGAPIFFFYFPLPYLVTALLWPVTWLGADGQYVYAGGCFLATLTTGVTCYLWLKDIVAERYVLPATMLFMFMPYRMELIGFRNAYSELWGVAFMPLVFRYARRLVIPLPLGGKLGGGQSCTGEQEGPLPNPLPQAGEGMVGLALSFAPLLLSHVPVAAVTALGAGLYMLVIAQGNWRVLARFGAAMTLGVAMAAFYLLPALYFKQFINGYQPYMPWADTFFSLDLLLARGQERFAMFAVLSVFLTGGMVSYWLIKDRRLQGLLAREMAAWGCIFAMALFLLFPVSQPLFALLPWLHQLLLPWRMQNLFAPCAAVMLAVWWQRVMPARLQRTWKMNFAVAMALLVMFDALCVGVHSGAFQEAESKVLAAHYVRFADQYQTRWTPDSHYTQRYLMTPRPRLSIISGEGRATIRHWGWHDIALESESKTSLVVHIAHMYFPIWQVNGDVASVRLRPDPASGDMLLDMPAGTHTITLRRNIFAGMPAMLRWLCAAGSAMLGATLLSLWLKRKNVDG